MEVAPKYARLLYLERLSSEIIFVVVLSQGH